MDEDRIFFVLIADDDEPNSRRLAECIRGLGGCVESVTESASACKRMDNFEYDMVFFGDALDVASMTKRARVKNMDSFIVAMTASEEIEPERRLRHCGLNYLLKKPWLQDEILVLVRSRMDFWRRENASPSGRKF